MGIQGHSATKNSAFSGVASSSWERSTGFSRYLTAKSTSLLVCTWFQQALLKAVTLLVCLIVAVIVLRTDTDLGRSLNSLVISIKTGKVNKREKPYILVITFGQLIRNNMK